MKYHKCPRCNLNYITDSQQICQVCQDEINHVPSIFDSCEEILCPFCGKNRIGCDEIMCEECLFALKNDK